MIFKKNNRKKMITIYLIGVVISWLLGFNNISHIRKDQNIPMTYGDVALVTPLAVFSWVSVIAWVSTEILESDIWDKPINSGGNEK